MSSSFDKDFVASVVEHMNSDHADAVRNYLLAFGDLPAGINQAELANVTLTDVTSTMLELVVESNSGEREKCFVRYAAAGLSQTLDGPDKIRSALVVMAKTARKVLDQ